jgi:hypothetical protein
MLDSDWFKFQPIKIELKFQNRKIYIRHQRKILRKMFNLKCFQHENLQDLGHPKSAAFSHFTLYIPFILL